MVAIKVALILNCYFMLILLFSFINGTSRLAEDLAARLIASPNIFDPINELVLLAGVAYVVAIERTLNLVCRSE